MYKNSSQLPESVQNVLPSHGQEIYLNAYNSAYQQYNTPSKREGSASQEETAHKVAWSAVKKVYKKTEAGNWERKE